MDTPTLPDHMADGDIDTNILECYPEALLELEKFMKEHVEEITNTNKICSTLYRDILNIVPEFEIDDPRFHIQKNALNELSELIARSYNYFGELTKIIIHSSKLGKPGDEEHDKYVAKCEDEGYFFLQSDYIYRSHNPIFFNEFNFDRGWDPVSIYWINKIVASISDYGYFEKEYHSKDPDDLDFRLFIDMEFGMDCFGYRITNCNKYFMIFEELGFSMNVNISINTFRTPGTKSDKPFIQDSCDSPLKYCECIFRLSAQPFIYS